MPKNDPYAIKNKIFVYPELWDKETLPVVVLCDDLRSFIGWAIKSHTKDNYSHVMIMHKKGYLVTQGFGGFKEISLTKYLLPTQMLKFWRIKNMTEGEKDLILNKINARLILPKWKKRYDFIGVFIGQLIRLKWIQSPFSLYCSEQVKADYIDPIKRLNGTIMSQPSPSDLNKAFMNNPDLYECLGYWWTE